MVHEMTLKQFEDHLLELARRGRKRAFTSDEVIQILRSYSPPEDLSELRDPKIFDVMAEQLRKSRGIGKMARVVKTIWSGLPGTKKLCSEFGWRLVKVRYYKDNDKKMRYKTVELIVDQSGF